MGYLGIQNEQSTNRLVHVKIRPYKRMWQLQRERGPNSWNILLGASSQFYIRLFGRSRGESGWGAMVDKSFQEIFPLLHCPVRLNVVLFWPNSPDLVCLFNTIFSIWLKINSNFQTLLVFPNLTLFFHKMYFWAHHIRELTDKVPNCTIEHFKLEIGDKFSSGLGAEQTSLAKL